MKSCAPTGVVADLASRYSALLLFVLLGFTGCTFYDWNLKHAYVTPWTHLSHSDRDEIVRLISDAAQDPIIGITRHKEAKDQSKIEVITGTTDRFTDRSWHGYTVQKIDGKWRIVFHGDASHTVANLVLAGEF
jgi:hypothetical protein